jgi:HEPN domain-containing protein
VTSSHINLYENQNSYRGAYTLSRYGDVECSVEDSKEVVNVASQLIELLEEVSRIVKLG